ncbi:MAG TPA: response regulator [Pirellulales bacterium]|nr:response regulator [Pirellulales bacterium]
MSFSAESRRAMFFRRCALSASVVALAVAILAAAGWILELPLLQSLLPNHPAMSPVTAIVLVLCSVSLFWQQSGDRSHPLAARACAGAVLLAGLAVLVRNILADMAGLGGQLGQEPGAGVPVTASLLFVLLGVALITMDSAQRLWRQLSEALALFTVAVSLLALMGYAYHEMILAALAFNTAVATSMLGFGMLCARPNQPLMALVTSDSVGGITLRRLLPAALLVPMLLVWLRLLAEQHGWVDRRFSMALFALSNAALFTVIIFWNAGLLHRMHVRNQLAQQALRASEERARNIINSAYDAFVAMNADGQIVDWNPQAEVAFGWSRAEVIGRQLSDTIVPPQYREAHNHGLAHFLATGEAPLLNQRVEITALHRDGHELPIELTISALRVQSAWLFGAFVHDITNRKRIDAELHRAKEAAEAANRAKSEFLANMSHEIRTPLNGVLGMTELVLDTDLNGEQREYLELAKTSADYLLAVINDILDFSKIEAGKLDLETIDFDVRELMDEAVTSLALRAHKKKLELLSHVASDVPAGLAGDPMRLRQVLVNLTGNAIKFTEHGEVMVNVELESPVGQEVHLHFSVRDTGIGIPADRQASLFQAFSQVDSSTTRKYGGTGLGLAISYSLVRMMGGQLWMESDDGRGSTFHFTTRFELAHQPIAPLVSGDMPPLDDLTVLVVDDNATNRRILAEMLTNWHMRATVAENGMQALDALEQALANHHPFDLVLLDNNMPEMDGFALAEKIKQHPGLVGATLMMLSSADRRGETARLRDAGLAAYLAKPVKQSELLNSIVNVLSLSKEHARRPRPAHQPFGKAPRKLHLLLAEDNAINPRVAVRLLEKRGHSVVVCRNGREALAALEREPFDAILLDVQMPELDGLETTAAIRDRERVDGGHLPIIAMTAHAMKGDREQCFEAGMDGYVAKPLEPHKLFETLESLLPANQLAESPAAPRAAEPAAQPAGRLPPTGAGSHPPTNSLPIFDEDAALGRVEGDRGLLGELIDIFLKQCPEWTTEIDGALAQRDSERLHRAAHTLKGAAGNLGFESVADFAKQLEMLSAASDWPAVQAAAAALEQAITQLAASPTVLAAAISESK